MGSTESGARETVGPRGRKPRIAFMGEFSAGKSTLSNLLIGSDPLPVKVTATQLPPVWISHGDGSAYREDFEGNAHRIELAEITGVEPRETRVIRVFQQSDILELCDLIDMPGISDPNLPPDLWQSVIDEADAVIWLTHATQAWRQSEAAVWDMMKRELRDRSLLLVTRFDKLLNERDRERVLKRVQHETRGLFAGCYPISLTRAMAARDDRDAWESSGAEAFMERLVALIHDVSSELGYNAPAPFERPLAEAQPEEAPEAADAAGTEEAEDTGGAPAGEAQPDPAARVTPRRVTLGSEQRGRSARPPREESGQNRASLFS